MATSQNMEYAKNTQLSTANKVMTDSKAKLVKSELETDGISGNSPLWDMVQISKAAEKGKWDSHNGLGDKLAELGAGVLLSTKSTVEKRKSKGKSISECGSSTNSFKPNIHYALGRVLVFGPADL